MPLYDYKCRDHGLFQELAMLSESAEPQPCPECSSLAARVIVLPPALLGTDPLLHEAMARNERSQHEPLFSTPEHRAEEQARHEHRHGKGCGCQDKGSGKSQVLYTADGKKWFPGARPWMISH
ncbi:zinc ribbon domain-containing protein [Nodosilinea sp. E11]|uniref:zinc ribbon domain-containing protein n=1 Tax=Nodosilinea sp. E11 TaxID=3037479 RepID=UPI002934B4E7|nr:zinc ribbon domain-containing protein [Nodosilinea sp. E11]WOD38384.1 zinc ribbon domain-containing protein [Nodosilinea sp. E11]